jgi:hypothetical protein
LLVTAGDFATLSGSGYADLWNYFPNALFNLFTPMLLGNLAARASVLVITVPLLFVGLFVGDLAGRRVQDQEPAACLQFAFSFHYDRCY